jgi:hypothetical protein
MQTQFTTLTFCTWDHNVSSRTNIRLQKMLIKKQLNEKLGETRERAEAKADQGWKNTILRGLGAFVTLVLLAGSSALIGYLVWNEESIDVQLQGTSWAMVSSLIVPVTVSTLKAASPAVIQAIVDMEPHSKSSTRFQISFMRIFAFKMVFLMVVLFQSGSLTSYIKDDDGSCKETKTGIQFYKIMWIEFVFDFMLSLLVPLGTVRFKKRCCKQRWLTSGFSADDKDGIQLMSDDDKLKDEFEVAKELIDVMYVQALCWSGAPFSPCLPMLMVVFSVIMIYVKQFQVRHLSRPPIKPMRVDRQNRLFRMVMLATLMVAVVPFTLFLSRKACCGPHNGSSPLEVLARYTSTLPSWFAFVLDELQSATLLTVIIILLCLYSVFRTKHVAMLKEDLTVMRQRLKTEVKEKQSIIRENGINIDQDKDLGKNLFKFWIETLGNWGVKYLHCFQETHFDDLIELCQLENSEVRTLMRSWRDEYFVCPESHIDLCCAALDKERLKLVR